MAMSQKTVLQLGGLHWATSTPAIESGLLRRPGVETVQANAANQTATVTYDPSVTSVARLAGWVRDCGYHCSGRSVPDHVCEPMDEPLRAHAAAGKHALADASRRARGAGPVRTPMNARELQPQVQPQRGRLSPQFAAGTCVPAGHRRLVSVGPVGLEPTTYGLKVRSSAN